MKLLTYRRMLIALVLAALFSGTGAAAAATRTFNLTLRGSDAIPTGDHNDNAKAVLTINTSKRTICWTFSNYNGIGHPSRGKIGKAPKGKNGRFIVTLAQRFLPKGCSTVAADTLTSILKRPAAYYLVITNVTHPHGAARAQL